MKGIAFAYDPDGYWVELVPRDDSCKFENEFNLSQTMIRVKDPSASIAFYELMGMVLVKESHHSDFSIYFMAALDLLPPEEDPSAASPSKLFWPALELTHNHGTEKEPDFKHYNGNEDDHKGFGHVGFLVDDVATACEELKAKNYTIRKEPTAGKMKGLAFAQDPDGYWVELLMRGGYEHSLPYSSLES